MNCFPSFVEFSVRRLLQVRFLTELLFGHFLGFFTVEPVLGITVFCWGVMFQIPGQSKLLRLDIIVRTWCTTVASSDFMNRFVREDFFLDAL